MSAQPTEPASLRWRLFLWLALPLSAVLVMSAVILYPIAVYSVRTGYDNALMDTAHSLARLLPMLERQGKPIGAQADTVLRTDQFDRTYYSVQTADGRLLAGDSALDIVPINPSQRGEQFYDTEIEGKQVRVASLWASDKDRFLLVRAAETTVKRDILTRQVATGLIAIEIILVCTVAVLLWVGIGYGLAPLEKLRREIVARSPRDLSPVSEEHAPVEAQALVRAINSLLQQLAATLRGQEAFVSNAAHQLRTPLAGVRMQVEYALQQDNPAEWQRALRALDPPVQRSVHLINQLLALAQVESSAVSMAAVDLDQELEELAAEWMPHAIAKEIDLGLELERVKVHGNRLLLRELVSNLVDNALRYSPQNGRVTVRLIGGGGGRLEVEDEGMGIPVEERKNVLRRFYRVSGNMSEGCGLGLAIVDEICTLHGATIEIRDGSSGSGTLVAVTFKLEEQNRN